MKSCTRCGAEKEFSEFHKRKASKDGREATCKACKAAYYQANKARIDARNEEWRKANPERAREIRRKANEKLEATGYPKEWREKNREKVRGYAKAFRERNLETEKKRSQRYFEENPDYAKTWYDANRDAMLVKGKKYRDAHRREIAERMQRYRAENPQIQREASRRRKARKAAALIEEVDEGDLAIRDSGRCGICGQDLYEPIELDHIIPLSRGGHHTPDNCQLTHRSCNRQKHDKLPGECGDIQPLPLMPGC